MVNGICCTKLFGETPNRATGTVALPFSIQRPISFEIPASVDNHAFGRSYK